MYVRARCPVLGKCKPKHVKVRVMMVCRVPPSCSIPPAEGLGTVLVGHNNKSWLVEARHRDNDRMLATSPQRSRTKMSLRGSRPGGGKQEDIISRPVSSVHHSAGSSSTPPWEKLWSIFCVQSQDIVILMTLQKILTTSCNLYLSLSYWLNSNLRMEKLLLCLC